MDLRDLYQETILDHSKSPRNARKPDGSNHEADGHNPLCGDKVTVACVIENGVVVDVGFIGQGCAISQAAASTMTEAVKGKTIDSIRALSEEFRHVVTGESELDVDKMGKLAVFAGVADYPMRVKCATLAWHTLEHAIDGKSNGAKTE